MKNRSGFCRNCRCKFEICPRVKKHEYCKKPECQRARKSKWQRERRNNDEIYRKDQKEAQEIWIRNNPFYWKEYRSKNKEYAKQNREKQRVRNNLKRLESSQNPSIAKMDAIKPKSFNISGIYKLFPIGCDSIAKMDAIDVKITAISDSCANSL